MSRLRLLATVASAVLASVACLAAVATAQGEIGGPTVTVDRDELNLGDQIVLTMSGFESRVVTMSVCGNEARRGSVDCNLPASRAKELTGPVNATTAQITVAAPPSPCPCVVRVSSEGDSEIAIAQISVAGHPVAPVVEPATFENPLAVSIAARAISQGVSKEVRASLGGSLIYEVTVTVRNRSTATLERVAIAGSVGRDADDVIVRLDLAPAQSLSAGQTWQQVVAAELPAPAYGSYTWTAAVSGAGPTVTATDETSHTPVLFWLLVVVLVVDLIALGGRFLYRRLRGRHQPDSDDADVDPDDDMAPWSDVHNTFETTVMDVVDEPARRETVPA